MSFDKNFLSESNTMQLMKQIHGANNYTNSNYNILDFYNKILKNMPLFYLAGL